MPRRSPQDGLSLVGIVAAQVGLAGEVVGSRAGLVVAGVALVVAPPMPLGATTISRDAATSRTASVTDGSGRKTEYTYDPLDADSTFM